MNILLVSQMYWPERFPINDVAAGLAERGHRVTVLTGLPNYPEGRIRKGYGWFSSARESHQGVEIVRVPLIPRGRGGGLRLALNYLSFALFGSLLGPLRVRGSYDVILVYEVSPVTVGIPAIVLRWLRGLPISFWVQDLWPESLEATGAVRSPRVLAWVAGLVRFIYSRCDKILLQSPAFAGPIKALGVAHEKITYLPNSAETFYRPMNATDCGTESAELPRGFRIVFAGNLGAAQDLPTLVAAAELTRACHDVHWIVFGDGRQRAWLEAEVRRLGLAGTVHLMGARAAERMPRYFAVADALLVMLRREPIFALTIPSKLQSYLACGRPVIAALDGAGARVVEEAGAGVVCPAESARDLAQATLHLRDTPPAERAAMGLSARAYFEANFERGALLTRLEAILQDCARTVPG